MTNELYTLSQRTDLLKGFTEVTPHCTASCKSPLGIIVVNLAPIIPHLGQVAIYQAAHFYSGPKEEVALLTY